MQITEHQGGSITYKIQVFILLQLEQPVILAVNEFWSRQTRDVSRRRKRSWSNNTNTPRHQMPILEPILRTTLFRQTVHERPTKKTDATTAQVGGSYSWSGDRVRASQCTIKNVWLLMTGNLYESWSNLLLLLTQTVVCPELHTKVALIE